MEERRRNDLHQLDVYRCALQLYRSIRLLVGSFPRGEADLRSQMRRASRSVPFNIGEGVGKRGRARAAAYEIALGETKELIVALDCVEIDELASPTEVAAAQELADRVAAMLTRLIRSALEVEACRASEPSTVDREPWAVGRDRDRDRDRADA
jgi:four helix bundle protein